MYHSCHGQPVLTINLKEMAAERIGLFFYIEGEKWLRLDVTSAFLDDAIFEHLPQLGKLQSTPIWFDSRWQGP